eukprot:COSAG02_NODE_24296_length_692_cov_1.583474_1_plen_90_part_00
MVDGNVGSGLGRHAFPLHVLLLLLLLLLRAPAYLLAQRVHGVMNRPLGISLRLAVEAKHEDTEPRVAIHEVLQLDVPRIGVGFTVRLSF